jgi:hypothetical protein
MLMKIAVIVLFCISSLLTASVFGDEITDRLQSGSQFYSQQKYSDAINEITYALSLIRQKQADELIKFFPPAPAGWQAEEAENQAAASMLIGGVTAVSKDYSKESGESVNISMAMDSPLLSSVLMFLSNPMFAGGKRIETIGGEKALVDYDQEDNSGTINIVVNSKLLLTIEGDDVSLDDMKGLVTAIEMSKLKSFVGN